MNTVGVRGTWDQTLHLRSDPTAGGILVNLNNGSAVTVIIWPILDQKCAKFFQPII